MSGESRATSPSPVVARPAAPLHDQDPDATQSPVLRPRRGRSRGGAMTGVVMVVTAVLLAVSIVQTVLVVNLSGTIGDQVAARQEMDAALEGASDRLDGLDRRTGASMSSTKVAQTAIPAVFTVMTEDGIGTAFVIGKTSEGATLVTNYHVVKSSVDSGQPLVDLVSSSGRVLLGTIGRTDERHDLALLNLSSPWPSLTAVHGPFRSGDPIVVIGAALGLDHTVTVGVISALDVIVPVANSRVIQIDAPTYPGNPGGPVLDADGQVVGVLFAGPSSTERIGFVIPISQVCLLVQC